METVVHILKVAVTMTLLSALIVLVGGWLLSLIEPGPWDKAELRDDERPIDYIGRRR